MSAFGKLISTIFSPFMGLSAMSESEMRSECEDIMQKVIREFHGEITNVEEGHFSQKRFGMAYSVIINKTEYVLRIAVDRKDYAARIEIRLPGDLYEPSNMLALIARVDHLGQKYRLRAMAKMELKDFLKQAA